MWPDSLLVPRALAAPRFFFVLLVATVLMLGAWPLEARADSGAQTNKSTEAGPAKTDLPVPQPEVAPAGVTQAQLELLREALAGSEQNRLAAFSRLQDEKAEIQSEFPDITDAMIEKSQSSVGVALMSLGRTDEAVGVLIREAWLLSTSARIYLQIAYKNGITPLRPFDPRILRFFRESAAVGVPRSQHALGEILLRGWGVEANAEEGRRLLRKADFGDSYMVLMREALSRGDMPAVFENLNAAAERDVALAHYELGIYAQEAGDQEKAFAHLSRAHELSPQNPATRLELARMYASGEGVPQDARRGFEMMKAVADEQLDPKAAAIAQVNVGFFYLGGSGVEHSLGKAREYLEKAAASGVEGIAEFAAKELEELSD